MTEGKLLGHIVSQHGVRIDPKRVHVIQIILLPHTKKEVQAFLGKISFLHRFIPNFIEIVKNITKILKRGNDIKRNEESKFSFEKIKNL